MKKTDTFHISTDGRDRAAGTAEEPFATPHGALAAIRRLRRQGKLSGGARLLLRGGTYELARTLVFRPEDSGSAKSPVVLAAHPGEAVVLSGGRRITEWRDGKVNGQPCWVAELPDVAADKWNFTQLFVNGVRRPRPRLPKTGYHRFSGWVGDRDSGQDWYNGPKEMRYAPGDIRRWRNIDDVKVVALQLWFEAHHRIKKLDTRRRIVHFQAKSLGSLKDEWRQFARYFVENVFEALDTPGEWYLDRRAGKLYYLPLPGEEISSTEVIAPRLETLVHFAGTGRQPVSHVRLENLSLQHAEWDYPPDDPGSIQAAFKVPGAVVFDRAEHCVLYGCEVAHAAQYAIEIRTGSHDNRIAACSLHELGAGGVRIDHEWMNRVDETSTARKKAGTKPMAATISDCRIHDAAKIHLSAIGIWVGNASRNRIVHNEIFNLNYTGISCGWTWGYAKAATMDNRIENNHIHHINWDGVLSDNGGIYTLGIQPGTTLRGNHIHHIGCYLYGGWGIYPDEGSSELLIENNVVHHTHYAGFSTHYGRDNLVRNNIFALARSAHVAPGKREGHRTTVFKGNLVYWHEGQLSPFDWATENYLFKDNLFFNANGDVDFGTPLTVLQERGQYAGTVIADPLFNDPEAGDFTLRAGSPAFSVGFRPIDVTKAGPRPLRQRPDSFDDWTPAQDEPRPIVRTRIETIAGDTVRVSVQNVGNAPASGRLRLVVGPADSVKRTGPGQITFKGLRPGATKTTDIGIQISSDEKLATIETIPHGKGLVPAMLHLPTHIPSSPATR